MKKKKAISQKRFERMVQISGVVVTLLVSIIASATSIVTAYISHPATPKPEIRYSLSVADLKELDRLRLESNQAERDRSTASTVDARAALNRRLRRLALDEAEIMRKYDPKFERRYPAQSMNSKGAPITFYILPLLLLAIVGCYFLARATARWFLRRHYEIEPSASS